MGRPFVDLSGKIFGQWSVIGTKPSIDSKGTTRWLCKCSCGREREVRYVHLLDGGSKSCGHYIGRNFGTSKLSSNGNWTGYKNIPGSYFYGIKFGANSRKLEFSLTIQDFQELLEKQKFKCALSGVDLYIKGYKDKNASLDRINSKIGYTKENCQWILKDINKMKNDLDQELFLHLCSLIVNQIK